jgi:16S rRNA (guanine966-N2)-methyltransferase
MRITGGDMLGRSIRVPRDSVRPTQDRVREALFSSLQTCIPEARVLDLFAGSGAVGLGALSRGASRVCWVEEDRQVFRILKGNVSKLVGSDPRVKYIQADVFKFLRKGLAESRYDIIFADPPYQKRYLTEGEPTATRLLQAVAESGLLESGGLFVLEQGSDEAVPESDLWDLIKDKRYGGTQLRFFRTKGSAV